MSATRSGGALEAAELPPLPTTPFVLARWSTATVGPDIHIKVGRTLYSAPWKLIGRKVDVRSTATMVQVFHDGQLVKTHTALDQGKRTDKSDYPPAVVGKTTTIADGGYPGTGLVMPYRHGKGEDLPDNTSHKQVRAPAASTSLPA